MILHKIQKQYKETDVREREVEKSVHCGKNSQNFRDAADQKILVTNFAMTDN